MATVTSLYICISSIYTYFYNLNSLSSYFLYHILCKFPMLSCLVYFHITYLILSCTFIYILILFVYCSFLCLLPVSSLFHVVSHVSILCLWHMLYLYFSYIHIHTCTIAYIHILSIIYFMLSYTFITFHVFSYIFI